MLLFDIGANRGDATVVGVALGYRVIALEAAPKVFRELVGNFVYTPQVLPLKMAVANTNNEVIEFYEAQEDGLSTMNKDWLTAETMPYKGKPFRTITATTITIDKLVELYGEPDLIKVDVEGAEWAVFQGMTKSYGMLAFEWTDVTIDEHIKQLEYLRSLGYKEVAPQFIVDHLDTPDDWYDLSTFDFKKWLSDYAPLWVAGGWEKANLRPTADVGMMWLRV